MIRIATALILILLAAEARSETVDVKYGGNVDLKAFECRDINRSSFIQRVCYDKAQSYMIISLKGTYYHYCELPTATFDGLRGAASMGRFYNQNIKGSGSDGPFDCRDASDACLRIGGLRSFPEISVWIRSRSERVRSWFANGAATVGRAKLLEHGLSCCYGFYYGIAVIAP